jgi:hypothetical protein
MREQPSRLDRTVIHLSSFRDAPFGAGPESILPAGVMDSALVRFAHAPE